MLILGVYGVDSHTSPKNLYFVRCREFGSESDATGRVLLLAYRVESRGLGLQTLAADESPYTAQIGGYERSAVQISRCGVPPIVSL